MNAKTVKTVNYTNEQTTEMVAKYLANPTKETVEAIAKEMGKTARSVVAKLSREKAYKKAEPVTKTGEPVEHKEELATAIGAVLGLDEASASSLAKANKKALQAVFAALANSKPI